MKKPRLHLFYLLFLLSACSRSLEVEPGRLGGHNVTSTYFKVESVKAIPWKVGIKSKVEIHKGVTLGLSLPMVTGEHNTLLMGMGIDSWVLQIYRASSSGNPSLIGQVYSLFPVSASGFSMMKEQMVFVKFLYSAASISMRFNNYPCPTFNHSYRVEDWDTVDSGERQELSFFVNEKSPLSQPLVGRVFASAGRPNDFNLGASLRGTYRFRVAFFNSREKTRMSEWASMKDSLVIRSETSHLVPGCAGFTPPERQGDGPDVNRFRL